MVDETKLNEFVGQMLSDLGGAASIALVRIGDALGVIQDLAGKMADDWEGTIRRVRCQRTLPS
jgi:hypothetical protein